MENYEESVEFQELLMNYQHSRRQGRNTYFDSDAFIDLAEYYMTHNPLDEAFEVIEDGLAFHPDEEALLALKANVLISLSRFDEAEAILARLDPKEDHDVYYFYGQLACGKEHDYERANKLFKKWLKIEMGECREMPNQEEGATRKREAFMHVIMSVSDLTETDKVTELLTLWVDSYIKQCIPVPGDDIDMDIARVCNEHQMYTKEIELYTHILDANPYLPQGWTYMASLQMLTFDIEGALNSVDFALAIDPDDTQALLVKGQSFAALNNYEEAQKAFKKYIDLSGENYYCIMLANCLMQTGKKEEAYHLLKEKQGLVVPSIKDRSMRSDMWSFISDIYREGGYYADAMRSVNNALRISPDSPAHLVQKGNIYLAKDDVAKAVTTYISAAAKEVNPISVLVYAASELMGKQYMMAALMFLKMVTHETENPEYVKAYPYIAYCYYVLGLRNHFLENLEKACQYTPNVVGELWENELMGVAPENYYQVLSSLLEDYKPF